LEKNVAVSVLIIQELEKRSYQTDVFSDRDEALKKIKDRGYPLVILGNTEGGESVFDVMKEIVMNAPMSCVILLTDAAAEEVEKKAEGYGLLGMLPRSEPVPALGPLLDRFEEISKAVSKTQS
jgi:DNA-binding response OmpR family regulator